MEEQKSIEEPKKTIVSIDGVEHVFEDLSDDQKRLVSHLVDLAGKIDQTKRSLEQFQVSHEAFLQGLRKSFEEVEVVEAVEVDAVKD